jgi:hypothetical protein
MICNNFYLFTFFRILPNNRVLLWPRTYGTHFYLILIWAHTKDGCMQVTATVYIVVQQVPQKWPYGKAGNFVPEA